MIGLGLTATESAAYVQALATSYQLRVRVQVMDTTHKVLDEVSDMLQSGQVTVDTSRDITRSASLELLDPKGVLPFDSNAPYDAALFMDRMLRITYGIRSPGLLDDWVDCPVFTGPISKLSRSGPVVNVECLGKEWLAQRPAWLTKNYRIGTRRTAIIKDLLSSITGETRFNIDDWTLKTAHVFGVTRETDVWSLAKRMAAGRLLYYDGNGTLVCRPALARSVYTFKQGTGGTLLSDPEIDYQADEVRNIVWVVGGVPKGAKYPVQHTAYADKNHPMSAQSLGRNGKARHLVEKIEDNDLLKESDCKERAEAELTRFLQLYVSVGFDAIPVPFLEEHDAVTVQTDRFSQRFGLDQFVIPLVAGASSSVGYVERRTANKSKIRRTRK